MIRDHLRTYKLNNGRVVLAKLYKGDEHPMTYTNRTQAEAMAMSLRLDLGVDAQVFKGLSRPFYVEIRDIPVSPNP